MQFVRSQAFTVPVTGTEYAPEILYLTRNGLAPSAGNLGPNAVTVVVDTFVTSVDVEVDVMDADGNWVNIAVIESANVTRVILDGLPARVRAQSGGSAGTQNVTVAVT